MQVRVDVADMNAKPFDKEFVLRLIAKNKPIYTLEELNSIGGLGSAVAEIIAESGSGVRFKRIGIFDTYTYHMGSQQYLRNKLIMNDLQIIEAPRSEEY